MKLKNNKEFNREDYIKIGEDGIPCWDCAFNEDCEKRFNQCVANYQHNGKPVHLKHCEYLKCNTMSDKEKAFFLQEVLSHKCINDNIANILYKNDWEILFDFSNSSVEELKKEYFPIYE